jgi:hypothetical protein
MRQRQAAPFARCLQDDRAHRVRHALDDDRHFHSASDNLADGVVQGEAVGDVAAGAVDVQGNRAVAVVRHFAQAFDHAARDVLFDVSDQVDVTQAIGRFLAEDCLDRVNQIEHQPIVQIAGQRRDL